MRGQTLRRITIGAAGPVALAVGSTAMSSPAWAESGPPPADATYNAVDFAKDCDLKAFRPYPGIQHLYINGYGGVVCASPGEVGFNMTVTLRVQSWNDPNTWTDVVSTNSTGRAGAVGDPDWYELRDFDCSPWAKGPWTFKTAVTASAASVTARVVSPSTAFFCD